jgi:transposase
MSPEEWLKEIAEILACGRKAIRAVGVRLIFLPEYSPDLNPIEKAFAELKTPLRKPAHEPSRPSQPQSEPSSHASYRRNAPTTSKAPDMHQAKCSAL